MVCILNCSGPMLRHATAREINALGEVHGARSMGAWCEDV